MNTEVPEPYDGTMTKAQFAFMLDVCERGGGGGVYVWDPREIDAMADRGEDVTVDAAVRVGVAKLVAPFAVDIVRTHAPRSRPVARRRRRQVRGTSTSRARAPSRGRSTGESGDDDPDSEPPLASVRLCPECGLGLTGGPRQKRHAKCANAYYQREHRKRQAEQQEADETAIDPVLVALADWSWKAARRARSYDEQLGAFEWLLKALRRPEHYVRQAEQLGLHVPTFEAAA